MKQPAINSLFQASKHYSQSQQTQERDFIVAGPLIDAKAHGSTAEKSVISLNAAKKPAKKSARAHLIPAEKPLTPLADFKSSKGSQKTATSTKAGKAVSKTIAGEDSSFAAADTLSLNSAKGDQPPKAKKRQTKKRQTKGKSSLHLLTVA